MDPSAPPTVLFTAEELPLFRDGMAGLHPLPPSFLRRPCWVHRAGPHPSDAIFDALPEDPVDPAVHTHFWSMLSDVVGVMTDDVSLRRRLLDAEGHGRVTLGYHASADYAAVRDHLRARGAVIEARELVQAPDVGLAPTEAETLRAVDEALHACDVRSGALMNYLHGVGRTPPTLPPRGAPQLSTAFERVTPRSLNAVHLRALDVLATTPRRLVALEERLCFESPAHDLHALWRAQVRARGVDEEALVAPSFAAWAVGHQVDARAWWLLDRAARDPAEVLARVGTSSLRTTIHRRLLYASAITWKFTRFRMVSETLLRDFGRRLDAEAIVELLRDPSARALRLPIVARREEILKGRRRPDRDNLVAALDAVVEAEGGA